MNDLSLPNGFVAEILRFGEISLKVSNELIEFVNEGDLCADQLIGHKLYTKLTELSSDGHILVSDVDKLYILIVYQSETIILTNLWC